MNKHIFNTIFYTKNRLLKPDFVKGISAAWNNQYLSDGELQQMQYEKLKKLLYHAYTHCPFYKQKFDKANFHPDQFHEFRDLEKIPFISKAEIRDNLDTITATHLPTTRREVVNTGGTTGIPMKLYRDAGARDWMFALYLRSTRMYGCSAGSKTAWIWGLKKEDEYLDFRNKDFKSRFMKNTVWFNGFDMNPASMKEFAEFSVTYKPELIISYVSSLFEYAIFLEKNNIRIHPPKAIWLTAEPVDEVQRAKIEQVFKCPTFSQYGSSEILHIATECKAHQGLHLHADSRYVEITDDSGNSKGPGETGYIVVTDLENYVMPLIRYKNDDMSSFSELHTCSCGSNFPKINPVMGRVYNVFKLKSGRQIYGHMFSKKLFGYVEEIRQFQIHQVAFDSIHVYLVPGSISDKSKLEDELLSYFTYYTGEEVIYTFHYVESIQREKSGKLLYTKSDVR